MADPLSVGPLVLTEPPCMVLGGILWQQVENVAWLGDCSVRRQDRHRGGAESRDGDPMGQKDDGRGHLSNCASEGL